MIELVVSPPVVAVEVFGELDHDLVGVEDEAVRGAVPSRRREFATGRACAAEALRRLGLPAGPVPKSDGGAPRWPSGVLGSITHCEGYRACVVVRDERVRGLGIDAEVDAPLPDGVAELVLSPSERAAVALLPAVTVSWDRLVFSAKESVFKAWSPLTNHWLDFHDVDVALSGGGTFSAVLAPGTTGLESFGASRLTGRWAAGHGLLATAVTLGRGQ